MMRCWLLGLGWMIGLVLTQEAAGLTTPDTIPYPTYQNQTLNIRIENPALPCDSIDTVGNTIYFWFYDQNRWFAKVHRYYDSELTKLEARYLAHMAVGPDKDFIAIYLGNYYEYSKNGILRTVIRFDEGLRHGPVFYYDRHGTLRQEGAYFKSLKSGLWRYYNKQGKLKHEVTYSIPVTEVLPEKEPKDNDTQHGRKGFI